MASPRTIELGSVLVVGACGFLGSHVVDHLLNFPSEASISEKSTSKGGGKVDPFSYPQLSGRYPIYTSTKVSALDLRTTHNRLPGAEYYAADIMSIDALLDVFKAVKPDVVIDTVSPPMVEGNREQFYRVNVDGTRNLLEVAGGLKGDWGGTCKAFVYTSSASVVHDSHSDLINADERWPLITGKLQREYYSETKVCVGFLSFSFLLCFSPLLFFLTCPSPLLSRAKQTCAKSKGNKERN
jgi:nucleoside-diphosphate-sugar epimerase